MSKTKRYYGSFKSRLDNTSWRVEIWQEGTFTAEEVTLQRNAVKIEWKDQDRMKPIRSSCATVKLISMSDRKFIDLYQIEPKNIRLDVYREDALYWSGTLDTEQYEEPYALPKGYVVSLSFSDFGVLDRLDVSGSGTTTIANFISYVVGETGINYGSIVYYISTKTAAADTSDCFQSLKIMYDNFFDEDEEADTIEDALSYVLEPFAAMIMQRNGNIYVFDYNSISSFTPSNVTWAKTDSVLSVGKVYNNVSVEWSPYAESDLADGEVEEEDVPTTTGMTVPIDENSSNASLTGFTIYASDTGGGVTKSQGKFFRIVSDYSGSDSAGIAWSIMHGESQALTAYLGTAAPSNTTTGTLFQLKNRAFISAISRDKFRIKISMDLLADVRSNPFESESLYNEEGDYAEMKERCNFVYIPIRLTLYDSKTGGTALYHYVNNNVRLSYSFPAATGWVAGASTSWEDAWLCYYDPDDRKESTGIGGWKSNKRIIGVYLNDLPTAYTKRDYEMITLPPVDGYLQVEIADGFYSYTQLATISSIYDEIRYLLYKDLKLEFVSRSGNDISLDDYTTKAWINRSAKEDLSYSTHIGSTDETSYSLPSARGVLIGTDGNVITKLYRAGVTDTVQRLLCGSVYSQFATRSTVLEGTVRIKPIFGTWRDANTAGNFFMKGEEQDLAAGTSDISMVNIKADSFTGIEWDND